MVIILGWSLGILADKVDKMIVGSEKRNRQLAFELENSHVCEKRSNTSPLYI